MQHAGSPKAFIGGKNKNDPNALIKKEHPSGTQIVMTATVEGVKMGFIAYKYNKRRILYFIFTIGAAPTTPGKPYIARWGGKKGNQFSREVRRPEVVARFFKYSNTIDTHNQSRQSDLGLEALWAPTDPWNKLILTIIGMTVVDVFRVCKYILRNSKRHKVHSMTMKEFAGDLARALLGHAKELSAAAEAANPSSSSSSSSPSSFPRKRSAAAESEGIELVSMPKKKMGKGGKRSTSQRYCVICAEYRLLPSGKKWNKFTSKECSLCGDAVHQNNATGAKKATGLDDCWTQHKLKCTGEKKK
jgi:hypothetical protein